MKKFFGLLALSLALLFAFSCSMFDETDNSGSVSFELSSDIIKNIEAHKSARDAWGPAEGDDDDDGDWGDGSQYQEKYIVEIKLSGSYTAQKSVEMTSEKQSITFEKIPIGSSVKADAVFYEVTTLHGNEVKTAWLKGSSDTIKVKQGSNTLKISLKYIYGEVPVTFTLTLKNQSDRPSSLANGAYSVIAYKAGSSSVSQFYNKFVAGDGNATEYATFIGETDGEDILGYGAWGLDPSNTATVNENAGAIILTGSMEMVLEEKAVFIVTASFQGPSGSGAVLPQSYIFAGYADNVTSLDALNASAIDVTGGEISASLKLSKIQDTVYTLYKPVSSGYQVYQTKSLSTFNPASSLYITSSTNKFVYDSKGNFYLLNYDASTSKNQIISNTVYNESSTSSTYTAINVDTATDTLYVFSSEFYSGDDFNGYIHKLSFSNDSFNSETYSIGVFPSSYTSSPSFVINNKQIYIPYMLYTSGVGYQLKLKQGTLGDTPSSVTLTEDTITVSGITISELTKINDVYYDNGYLYLLIREGGGKYGTTGHYVASRGAVIKYDVSDGTAVAAGFAPATTLNSMKTAVKGNYPIMKSENPTDYFTYTYNTSGVGGFEVRANYNNNTASSYFVGPEKVLAIKPKKLVISDTGIAIYTNSDGLIAKKKINRVVELDLENLSMENTVKSAVSLEFASAPTENFGSGPSVNVSFNSVDTIGYKYNKNDATPYSQITSGVFVYPYFIEE